MVGGNRHSSSIRAMKCEAVDVLSCIECSSASQKILLGVENVDWLSLLNCRIA
jgi:hypothetical protein